MTPAAPAPGVALRATATLLTVEHVHQTMTVIVMARQPAVNPIMKNVDDINAEALDCVVSICREHMETTSSSSFGPFSNSATCKTVQQ